MPGADVSAQPQFSLHSITVIQRLPVIRFLLTQVSDLDFEVEFIA